MEAASALSYQSCAWIESVRGGRRTGRGLRMPQGFGVDRKRPSSNLQVSQAGAASYPTQSFQLKASCCCNKKEESGKFRTGVDEALILKKKSEDVIPYLNERCIFLVGMMGSGKTTVGKILSEVLCYSFFDRYMFGKFGCVPLVCCHKRGQTKPKTIFALDWAHLACYYHNSYSDKLVEKAVGMYSVAQIFKERSEAFFRDNESNALRDLSLMRRLVVATGGGAVIRPINWRYMKKGITVWLDVPLEALARRIAAVGTESRPLLHNEAGDPYKKALIRLSTLSKERGDAYANADARVCLQNIASKQGHGDVSALTPTAIAIEALIKIEGFLSKDPAVEKLTYF